MEAWHFVGPTLRDGRPIPNDGKLLRHDGELELCVSGLHASERLIDALRYAPGNTLCRVQLSGEILRDHDKLCAAERTIIWRIDADSILREFARWAALRMVYLWDAPEVVRRFLETGDEDLRAAARASASAAASAAARAWRNAAWAAARASAWASASAAGDAATAGAWVAAWDADWAAQNEHLTEMVMKAYSNV